MLAALLCAGTVSAADDGSAPAATATAQPLLSLVVPSEALASATAQATSAQDRASAREKALARKARGKKMVFWGLAIGVGGAVVGATESAGCLERQECSSADRTKGLIANGLAVGGGTLAGFGIVEWRRGSREANRQVGFAVGKNSAAAAYHLRW